MNEPAPHVRRANVAGLGLIGGSVGLALAERGWHVTGDDLDPARVDRAIAMLGEPGVHSVAGIASDTLYRWRDGRPDYFTADGRLPNSTELTPTVWETTGLYANRADVVRATGRRLDVAHCRGLLLSRLEAVDINTPEDFAFAELLWRGIHAGAPLAAAAAPR